MVLKDHARHSFRDILHGIAIKLYFNHLLPHPGPKPKIGCERN